MSSGHATVRRPLRAAREAAFVLEERREPASANGVFVNSQKISPGVPHELSDGDMIRLGTTELQFKSLWLPPGVVGRG
jgi:pSer/pThr/pTyr-binding forkhead associated (FHA) protein